MAQGRVPFPTVLRKTRIKQKLTHRDPNGRGFQKSLSLLEFYSDWLKTAGGRNLEQWNVERPIFRNFKIANIKITKDELFDNFIFEFNFSFFRNHLNTENI